MGHPANEYATFAYLNEDYVPVLCTPKKADKWFWSEDQRRSQIKLDYINGWGLETRFRRFSLESDGPPLFWQVSCWAQAAKVGPFQSRIRWFGTKDAALEFHMVVAAAIARGDTVDDDLIPLEQEFNFDAEADDEEDHDQADWWKE